MALAFQCGGTEATFQHRRIRGERVLWIIAEAAIAIGDGAGLSCAFGKGSRSGLPGGPALPEFCP